MFIVVEGCVGAGKSTVAAGLAAHRGSKLLAEQFEQNPFLTAFYEDPKMYATETEFMFLLLHFHQLKQQARNIGKHELISDFHIGKDLLYADVNFENSEALRLFKDLYDFLNAQLPLPALLIGLSATTELLLQRIQKRDREFELKIAASYYGRINATYKNFFESYPGRKLIIPMDEWDFVANPSLYERLSKMVDSELRKDSNGTPAQS